MLPWLNTELVVFSSFKILVERIQLKLALPVLDRVLRHREHVLIAHVLGCSSFIINLLHSSEVGVGVPRGTDSDACSLQSQLVLIRSIDVDGRGVGSGVGTVVRILRSGPLFGPLDVVWRFFRRVPFFLEKILPDIAKESKQVVELGIRLLVTRFRLGRSVHLRPLGGLLRLLFAVASEHVLRLFS